MLLLVLCCAALLLLAGYVAFVLFVGNSTETGTSLADYISESTIDDSCVTITVSKYCTKYEEPGKQLLILYGTEYGFSEEVAKKIFDHLMEEPYDDLCIQPRVVNAKDFHLIDFSLEQVLLCAFSTTGDGVPPTESRGFIDCLNGAAPPSLSHLCYSVLALGDSSYPHYCRAGKELDARLQELGARCLRERADIDLEDWYAINTWLSSTLEEVVKLDLKTSLDYLDLLNQTEDTGHSRTRPFMAKMTVKYMLTSISSSSDKETLHAEFDLTDSGLEYTSGDALGIYPLNNPPEVAAVITALQCSADQLIAVPAFCYHPKPEGEKIPIGVALTKYFDLKTVKLDLVKLLAQSAIDEAHRTKGEALLKEGFSKRNEALSSYLSVRELVDVLRDFSSFSCPLEDLLTNLRALQPRYYSIASSPKQDSSNVAACAAVLRYTLQARPATGVCTTFLQDRLTVGELCPVFMSQNPDFRLPKSGETPIIMIGPGTGIAPFRAFIQERVLTEATGKNVLYFGCRHKNQDFLYSKELEQWSSEGVLDLRTAFSRDQPEKVYVQDLIRQDSVMLWKLLQDGAHMYVCGDALHMAGDVHQAVLGILAGEGGLPEDEAEQYMQRLEKTARYQRDVWVT